ncbi:MAG: hypothetical protein BWX63_02434 [Bacteroidetes bacterium ADurb.Bin041]|nr:MAG: hypothetical protein BWX63_02434 [Bacteroidetes bacterium ADurb.Bin041]
MMTENKECQAVTHGIVNCRCNGYLNSIARNTLWNSASKSATSIPPNLVPKPRQNLQCSIGNFSYRKPL